MISMKLADKITAIILIVIGVAMFWGGFVMDRLEVRAIHPFSIPGLVPMGLGVAIAFCGALLFLAAKNVTASDVLDLGNRSNLIWAVVFCLIFSTVLVGNIPFFLAAFLFISAFSIRFTWSADASTREKIQKVAISIAIGLVFSSAISALFRYAFLVRLP